MSKKPVSRSELHGKRGSARLCGDMDAVRKPVPGLNPSNPGGKLSPEDKVVSMLTKINCDLVTVQTAI